jgi:hypothetical protein
MFVSPAFSVPVFYEREDRRSRPRFPYRAVVQIDGRRAAARDMSSKGLSVVLAVPAVGDIVRVTLSGARGDRNEVSSPARVVRIDSGPDGITLGLEFIE